MRRLWKALVVIVLLLLVGVGLLAVALRHAPPAGGSSGADADAMAHAVEKAVNVEAWNKLGAVRWTWTGAGKVEHLVWDRKRNTANVKWKNNEVMLDVAKATGRAFVGGVEQTGEAQAKLVDAGMKRFYNDSFWLNPLPKLFDDGVTREKVAVDGKPGLFVHYASGGATPGDKYLWLAGDDGLPRAWRIWVSVVRIPGLEISWEDWTTLPNGAKVALTHKVLGMTTVKISDLQVADSYEQLPK